MNLLDPANLELASAEDRAGGPMRAVLDALEAETADFASSFSDDPGRLSDWGHRYFCPEDGGRLEWNRLTPHRHVCVVCGREYSGTPYDGAWTTFYRNEAFQTLRKAAVLSRLRPGTDSGERWRRMIVDILGYYADRYGEFALHAKSRIVDDLNPDVAGAARIMPQGLNEAIILVRAVQALEAADPEWRLFPEDFRERVTRGFVGPAVAILGPQQRKVHNIGCWIDAGLGHAAIALGDEDLLVQAIDDSRFGIQAQLRGGLTEDWLWFEGSIHYHYFALEAVYSLLLAAARLGIRRPRTEEAALKALDAGYRLAFSTGRFPAPNDGWPDVGLKTYAHVHDLAAALHGPGSEADALRDAIDASPGARVEVPLTRPWYYRDSVSLERVLFAPFKPSGRETTPPRESRVLRGSCFAMLRKRGVEVFMKYGHNGPSHAHPDKMTIEASYRGVLLTRDLSNAGYGARLCDAWHRSSPAHNTVVVDGRDHLSTERGRVLWLGADRVSARAIDVYPGVHFNRAVVLAGKGFTDVFEVESDEERVFDWFFHVEGELAKPSTGKPANTPTSRLSSSAAEVSRPADLGFGGPYSLLEEAVELEGRAELRLDFELHGAKASFHASTEGMRIFLARSLDNPVDGRRTAIILRARGRRARFNTSWKFHGGTP